MGSIRIKVELIASRRIQGLSDAPTITMVGNEKCGESGEERRKGDSP
jgi:hypothetical protein